MTEEVLVSRPEREVASASKWGKPRWHDQANCKVAHAILQARLQAVWHCLPLAAEKSDEDVEHVHQLRIATRRAAEALRVFAALIPDAELQDLRARLRQIRLAADAARNLDVLADQFRHGPSEANAGVVGRLVEELTNRRREAQQPIVAIHAALVAEKFDEQTDTLLQAVISQRQGKAKRKFGRDARQHLKAVLKKFFKASVADLSDDHAFHELRIRTKRLRYTMEMVAVSFAPSFRKKLYRQISELQAIMGVVNDHALGKVFFRDWSQRAQDAEAKAFLEGLAFGEARAHRDLHQAFMTMWTRKTLGQLRRQFRAHARLP